MADKLFTAYAKEILDGTGFNWGGVNIRYIYVDHADDTPVVATDDFLDDIAGAARVAESGNLAGVTTTGGVVDFTANTIAAVSGDQFESIVFFEETGVDATSTLALYVDSASALPVTPSGTDIILTPHASGLFGLV